MDKNKQKPDQANKPKEKDCSSLTDEEFKAYQEKERKKEKSQRRFFCNLGCHQLFQLNGFYSQLDKTVPA